MKYPKELLSLAGHMIRDALASGNLPEGFGQPWQEKRDELAKVFSEASPYQALWRIIRAAEGKGNINKEHR
jgi:hypothetical protein